MAVEVIIPKPIYTANEVGAYSTSETDNLLNDKVDKETGKGLSENDFTDALKTKLDGIEAGAEVNVNADWNAVSGDALILNKPTIPDVSGLVPYTGAIADVDLGTNGIDAKFVNVKGTGGNGKLGLKHQSSNATAGGQETVIFAGSDGEPRYKNDGNAVEIIASRAWVGLQGFITNVVTALGYTPVPNTRTINGYDLTANRTLTASDVGAVATNSPITGATKTKITFDAKGLITSGADATTADIADSVDKRYITDAQQTVITNTSGTNTGDETSSSILSKLGWFFYNRVAESVAVTGTTAETIIENIKINANTFASGGILRSYNNKFRKVGTAGSLTIRLYIGPNSNNLTGATQIAMASIPAANLFAEMLRTFTATTTALIGWNSTTSAVTDNTLTTAARTETAVTWSNDQYFMITVQLASGSDSVSLIGASLKNF